MPRLLVFVVASLWLLPPPLAAQREISLLGLTGNAAGHARADLDPDRPTIAPDHPASWQLGLATDHGPWRVALLLRHARADLAIRGTQSAVLTRDAIRAWRVGVEVGHRVAGAPDAAAVHLLSGIAAARTTFPVTGGDPRTVVTGHLAVQGRAPLTPRWLIVVRGEGGIGGALFDADELPSGYAVRAGREWSLGVGLGWRP
ncbi:MAG: hypothetical protein IPJ11_02725 [Gemmatimonadetes bacterium]|nr:hypothetical protein [Gemmatimonadota bacterium]